MGKARPTYSSQNSNRHMNALIPKGALTHVPFRQGDHFIRSCAAPEILAPAAAFGQTSLTLQSRLPLANRLGSAFETPCLNQPSKHQPSRRSGVDPVPTKSVVSPKLAKNQS